MKSTGLLFLTLSILLIVSCTKSDNPKKDTVNGVTSMMLNGTWRITSFIDDGDETSNYSGYSFSFAGDNSVTASKEMTVYTGTWSITDSNSKKNKLSDLDFNLFFASPDFLEELSDDWDIAEKSETRIKLVDDNGSDQLIFERN